MNKNVMIALIIVLLLLIGAGSYLVLGNKSKTASASPTPYTETQITAEESVSQKQSLKSLMGSAIPQKCAFNDVTTNNSGTVYTSGGQMRGDFVSTAGGQAVTSHMIADTTTFYVWTEGQTQGFKIAKDAAESIEEGASQKNFDVNKQIDYTCVPWSVNTSLFEVPADVTFSDFSGMMQGLTAPSGNLQGESMKSVGCAACESLTGDEQSQCKQALGC